MKGTITNTFFKQARIKTPAEIEEDAKRREEQIKLKADKKAKREEELKNNPDLAKKLTTKKPKEQKRNNRPNILTA